MMPRSRPGRRPLAIAVAAVAVVILAAACGRTDPAANLAPSGGGGAASAASGEIVVAATYPQSGPLAAVASIGRGAEAYLRKVNASGGINGRQIRWVSYDDAYDPARMTANARRAVEADRAQVVISFGGPSLAIRPYLNQQKVFHLALAGNTPLSDTATYPYTHAWYPDIMWEAQLTAQYVQRNRPGGKVAVIGLNNDITDSAAAGFTAAGVKPALVLKAPPASPDVTALVTQMASAGVDVVYSTLSAAQLIGAVKYMKATKYAPMVVLYSTTAGRKNVINALGPAAKGLYTNLWLADPADPLWAAQSRVAEYQAAVAQYGTAADADDLLGLEGYAAAEALVAALQAARTPTADGIVRSWESLEKVRVTGLPPGTTLTAGPGGRLVYNFQLVQFGGTAWKPVGRLQNAVTAGVTQ